MACPRITEIRDPNVSPGTFTVILSPGDIQIGAVEVKDAATDVRVGVAPANSAVDTSTPVMRVQMVDDEGEVPRQSTQESILSALSELTNLSTYTLLNAAISPGAGNSFDLSASAVLFQIIITGEVSIQIEVSVDNTNWITIDGAITKSQGLSNCGPVKYARAVYAAGTGTATVLCVTT